MPDLQGLAHFPGLQQIISASFSLVHGITPSSCLITFAPQAAYTASLGTLSFTFGSVRIDFPECAANNPSMRFSQQGHVQTLTVLDRRWRWQYGEITGRYNRRLPSGVIDTEEGNEKTPQELAKLLLEAMKEQNFDLSTLPNKSRPIIFWDSANPAQELASLCESLNCRIVLTLKNKVVIHRLGEGSELPLGGVEMSAGIGVDALLRPSKIAIKGGPTRFQSKLKLEAVGEDTEGEIKKIDDLSYKPANGWETVPTDSFGDVAAAQHSLAAKTVFKWYRVVSQADGTQNVPGYGAVDAVKQILPIGDKLNQEAVDVDGVKRPLEAFVEGVFYPEGEDRANTAAGTRYPADKHGFSIDAQRGIVQFSQPVVKVAPGEHGQAELYLTTTYEVTDEEGVKVRDQWDRAVDQNNKTGPRVVWHPEIVAKFRAEYDDQNNVTETINNRPTIDPEGEHYLDALVKEYEPRPATTIQYAGLVPIEPDGAIQQVTWTVGGSGATTHASRNIEGHRVTPSYKERRRQENLRNWQALKAATLERLGAAEEAAAGR